MNLGVETPKPSPLLSSMKCVSAFSDESWGGDLAGCEFAGCGFAVSAFSDESWGGDLFTRRIVPRVPTVSAFSDESWGGDLTGMPDATLSARCFSIL